MGGDVDLIDAVNEVQVAQNEVLLPSSSGTNARVKDSGQLSQSMRNSLGMDAKTLNDIKRAASEDKNPLAQSKSKTNDDISNKDRDDMAFKDLTQ